MAYSSIIGDMQTVLDQLNKPIILGPFLESGLFVHGRTLNFPSPGIVVMFSATSPERPVTIKQIVTQIQADLSSLAVVTVQRRALTNQGNAISATASGGRADPMVSIVIYADSVVTLTEAGSTAASDFMVRGEKSTGPVLRSNIIGFSQGTTPGHYVVLIATP